MASALQCPACGHKHRLTALAGDPVFACEQCGRLLKTPVEYRRPDPTGTAAPPRPNGGRQVQRGGSAARDQTSVLATSKSAPGPLATNAPRGTSHRSAPRPPATFAVPLLALGWVVAVLLGGVLVRYFAKFTGLLTGDSLIDILTGSGWGRYLRLFALVPFWALATAGLMTVFVEGARRWEATRQDRSGRPAKPPMAKAAATKVPAPKAPAPKPRPADTGSRPTTQSPAAAESRSPTGAAAAPRPRRIPKRDISS